MDKAVHALIQQQHPDGVPETEMDALAQRLKTRGTLQVVASDFVLAARASGTSRWGIARRHEVDD